MAHIFAGRTIGFEQCARMHPLLTPTLRPKPGEVPQSRPALARLLGGFDVTANHVPQLGISCEEAAARGGRPARDQGKFGVRDYVPDAAVKEKNHRSSKRFFEAIFRTVRPHGAVECLPSFVRLFRPLHPHSTPWFQKAWKLNKLGASITITVVPVGR